MIGAVMLLIRVSLISLGVSWMMFVALSQGYYLILVSVATGQWSDRYSDILQFYAFRSELTSVKIRSGILL